MNVWGRRIRPGRPSERERLQAEVQALRGRVEALREAAGRLRARLRAQEEEIRRLRRLKAPDTGEAAARRPSENSLPEEIERAHGVEFARALLELRGHGHLPAHHLRRLEAELMSATREEVLGLCPGDRVLSNFVLNLWEWGHGESTLSSLPWNISLPVSDVCNARCSFCTSWLDGEEQLTLEQLEWFEPVLRTAVYVGLVGHGEPFSHPRLDEIADRLTDYLDPRAVSYTITNGAYLGKWRDRLDQLRLTSVSCSLNAATPETHELVMGLPRGEFARIVEDLRALAAGKMTRQPIAVSLTLVVTRQNIHEIPAFIELGNEIRATSVYLRTLLPQPRLVHGLNYHLLPAYLHPDFERLRANAIAAMQSSAIPVYGEPDTWANPVFPAELGAQVRTAPIRFVSREEALRDKTARAARRSYYRNGWGQGRGEPTPNAPADNLKDGTNPLGRHAPFRCRAVYNNLYVNELFLRVSPCCYLTHTPGYDEVRLKDVGSITDAWNAPSLRELRRRLNDGPLFGACERCPENW